MYKTALFLLVLSLGTTEGGDVGCTGSTSGGNQAIGCVTRGCCAWDNHITSTGLCDGANEVCCYSSLNPGCNIIGEPGGPSGEDSCIGTSDGNGNPAIGCVKTGCCEFTNQISAFCSASDEVCCYSRDTCSGGGGGNCNNVQLVTRSQWGARSPNCRSSISLPVPYMFIHYTAGQDCFNQAACSAEMRSIQNYHMDSPDRRYCDIGYNFLIGGDGRVYEGRGWGSEGAHTRCYNTNGVAMSFMGNFNPKLPTAAALQAARDMLACAERDALTSNYELFGHRDASATDCPGNMLYSEIQSWPEYSFRSISRC